jgi:hypothetical protein
MGMIGPLAHRRSSTTRAVAARLAAVRQKGLDIYAALR